MEGVDGGSWGAALVVYLILAGHPKSGLLLKGAVSPFPTILNQYNGLLK